MRRSLSFLQLGLQPSVEHQEVLHMQLVGENCIF